MGYMHAEEDTLQVKKCYYIRKLLFYWVDWLLLPNLEHQTQFEKLVKEPTHPQITQKEKIIQKKWKD